MEDEEAASRRKRVLATLVGSLASQSLLFLLKSSSPSSLLSSLDPLFPNPNNFTSLPLLIHLLSTSQISTSLLLTRPNNKRKRGDQEEEPLSSSSCSSSSSSTTTAPLIPTNPDNFKRSFGMSSSTFEWLSGLLDPLLDCRDRAECSSLRRLSSPARLALALSRLSSGAPYSDVARRFSVSELAARFCTKRLCRVLCTNFRFWIGFPSSQAELLDISDGFRAVSNGMPDCCGAIACARFEIGGGRAVAAQIVTHASSGIISIAAGFRGERGDGEILRSSSLYKDFENGRILGSGQYLVGGDGYPLLSWLMVPFADASSGSIEEDFNAVLGLMRRPAQRAISNLRNWGVLSRLMEEDGRMAVACIGTCAILHNVLLMREDCSVTSDVPMEGLMNVEKRRDKSEEEWLEEGCDAVKKGFELRSALAMKARAVGNSSPTSEPSVDM